MLRWPAERFPVAVSPLGQLKEGARQFQCRIARLFRIRMEFDDLRKMADRLFRIVVVQIDPSQPQHGFRGLFAARGVFQGRFVDLDGAVVFPDEGEPRKIVVPVPLEKQIGNLKLAFDDLVIVDACHMALGQFLKAVEFGSVFASFAVCPCRADQCVDFLDGIIRLEVGFQIGVRGGEKFALIFQLPAGGERLQCGFLIRGQGKNHCGRQSQKYDFQAHRLFFLSQIVCFIPDDGVS